MRWSAASPARFLRGSSAAVARCARESSSACRAISASGTTRSIARSRSSASSSSSSRRRRRLRSWPKARARSRHCARRSAQRIPRMRRPARSVATSRWRCRTTSSTAPTRQNPRSARSRCGSRTMSSSDVPEYVARNVELWTRSNERYTDQHARQEWTGEIRWGTFGIPESEVHAFGDVAGKDAVELGCGTAYMSARLARHGAHVVGVDPTPAQLETARRMQAEFGVEFPLIEAVAEAVPLPDASFDLVHSEYGASIWADPYKWIPEAARLLRPAGRLVFLRNSTLLTLCQRMEGGPDDRLHRPQFGLGRIEWPDTGEVEFHPPPGELIEILRDSGFDVERL